jgi:hypothetical protein
VKPVFQPRQIRLFVSSDERQEDQYRTLSGAFP